MPRNEAYSTPVLMCWNAVYIDKMTKVITLCTSKGGTSKTSLAASLLDYWNKKGLKVAGVDADPNCNLTRWLDKGSLKNIPHVAQTLEGEIISTVENISNEREIVIVDIAGFGNQSMVYAIGISSLVVIPSRPSEDDVTEALKTKQIVTNASSINPSRDSL